MIVLDGLELPFLDISSYQTPLSYECELQN
jgi:hypothetical protein